MRPISKYMGTIIGGSAFWARVALVVLMLLMSADVVARYAVNKPILGATEFSEILMAVLVLLGLANTQAKGMTVKAVIFVSRLPRKLQILFATLSSIMGLCVYALIAWQGAASAWEAFQIGEKIAVMVPYPLWPAKVFVPFGAGLLCLQLLMEIPQKFKT